MDIEIIEEKENPLLERKEVVVRISHTGYSTPPKAEIRKVLIAKLSASDDRLILGSLNQRYGAAEALATVKIYKSKKRAQEVENPHVIKKNFTAPEVGKEKPVVAEEPPKAVEEKKKVTGKVEKAVEKLAETGKQSGGVEEKKPPKKEEAPKPAVESPKKAPKAKGKETEKEEPEKTKPTKEPLKKTKEE